MTFSGGATSNLGGLMQGLIPGGQAPGTIVGQEQPEWEFPQGQHRIPQDLMEAFFRSDAGPTGFNEFLQQAMQTNPGLIDRLRSYINMGLIRPKNPAAQNIVTGFGGYRAGDMTPLGPLINGMPSGLNESQLNTFANILQTGTQYNLGLLEQMGYFDGMPTLERERVMGELAQGWMQEATQQFLAAETQRSNMAQEGLSQQEITNQNIQRMAEIFGGQMTTDPATGQSTFQPTEEARQFNTEQSGFLNGQATLTREQQAFNQAKDVANLASNPRNYMEAQMLANARGGLGGMAPNNQVQQTTFGPATTTQQPQFQAPGGQYNQLPGLKTMQGTTDGDLRSFEMAGGSQAGAQMAMPNAQQAGQPTPAGTQGNYNLQNADTWRQMLQGAGSQWAGAQPMLNQVRQGQDWQSILPVRSTPTTAGPGQPPWPGTPTGFGPQPQPGGFVYGSDLPYERAQVVGGTATPQQQYDRQRLLGGPQPGAAGTPGVGFQAPTPGQPGRNGASSGVDGFVYGSDLPYERAQVVGGTATPQQQQWRSQLLGSKSGLGSQVNPGDQQFELHSGGPSATGQERASPMASFNRGQDVAGANGPGQQFATSNFTQSLMQNRVVPKTGGLSTPGKYMTAQQIQAGFNPNKVRTQDYLRGTNSQQQGFNAVGSMAGYSDEDLSSIMKQNLPSFSAPKAGRMI